jgi:HK97 family phage portal protein
MRLFGFEITRKAWGGQLVPARPAGILGMIQESFAGAWQKNVTVDNDRNLLAFSAVYACVSLIANDISKLRPKLVMEEDGVDEEVTSGSPFLPVLRKPNHFQNRIQFYTQWICSKLLNGNAYVMKERDQRGVVTGMYVLNPSLVTPAVAPNGEVFYQLNTDYLNLVETPIQALPASEIIHDRMPALWHPLLGVSPIYACGASATQGIRIQANSANFFENMSRPSGILTAPGHIPDETALRMKQAFEDNFSGTKVGRLAVLGDGLKFDAMAIPAQDAQLIEQLKWTVEDVARCFHVPLHMIGGAQPTYNNVGALSQSYYTQTLQTLIESLELSLSEGLSLPTQYDIEFDLEALLRMDTASRYDAYSKAIGSGWMSPNEARERENLEPVEGGQTPYLQQQNWSLAQLDRREMPTENPQQAPTPPQPENEPPEDSEDVAELAALLISKTMSEAANVQT